jgi:hypothetical protein
VIGVHVPLLVALGSKLEIVEFYRNQNMVGNYAHKIRLGSKFNALKNPAQWIAYGHLGMIGVHVLNLAELG